MIKVLLLYSSVIMHNCMPQSLETGKFDKYIGGKYFKDIGVWVCVCGGWGVD